MASMMGICGGLVGPKSENVEKVVVFVGSFEGSRGPRVRQNRERPSEPERFDIEKVIVLIKHALCRHLELCFLCRQGRHFQKKYEKSGRKVKNGAQIMSDTLKYHQNGFGYTEMSSKECWIHH